VRARHAAWCVAVAEAAAPRLTGPEQASLLRLLDRETANIRSALTWMVERTNQHGLLRLTSALWFYWFVRSNLTEGRRWLALALENVGDLDPPGDFAAEALVGAGTLAHYQGDEATAHALLAESLARWRQTDNPWGIAVALVELAVVAEDTGNYSEAARLLSEALRLARSAPEPIARIAITSTGSRLGLVAWILYHVGIVAWGSRDTERASAAWDEAMGLLRDAGHLWGVATTAGYLGLLACEQGRFGEAATFHRESLDLRVMIGVREDLAGCLADIATLAIAEHHADVAARLFGAAAALRETIGAPAKLPERAVYDGAAERARVALGDLGFAAAVEVGRGLALDDAIALARNSVESAENAPSAPQARITDVRPEIASNADLAAKLTPRELDVLRLLAAGRSTPEIAETLAISPRTATTHIANLLGKLEVETRAAAVALAYRQGLT
jgi:non-specific serine/threonine protein kinase